MCFCAAGSKCAFPCQPERGEPHPLLHPDCNKKERLTDEQHGDRARAPREGERCAHRNRGSCYFFMRGDYVRLKTLAYQVHKDAVSDLLSIFKPDKIMR